VVKLVYFWIPLVVTLAGRKFLDNWSLCNPVQHR